MLWPTVRADAGGVQISAIRLETPRKPPASPEPCGFWLAHESSALVNVRARRDAGPFQSRPHRLINRLSPGRNERGASSSGGKAARLPEGASLLRCWRKAGVHGGGAAVSSGERSSPGDASTRPQGARAARFAYGSAVRVFEAASPPRYPRLQRGGAFEVVPVLLAYLNTTADART